MGGPSGRERFDEARLINIANALTAVRVLLVPLFAHFLITGRVRRSLLVFAICGLSDGLDGLVARKLRQRTVVGFYLDPIADKLLMATAFIVLAYVKILPVWLAVLVISRDLFILAGSVLILLLKGTGSIRTSVISKANTFVQLLTVIYFLAVRAFPRLWEIAPEGTEVSVTAVVVGLCAMTTAVSGLQYLFIGMRQISDV
jgi:cardiolipin synthase